jgi:hypothetical protein
MGTISCGFVYPYTWKSELKPAQSMAEWTGREIHRSEDRDKLFVVVAVLGFELMAYTLSHSTSLFVIGFFRNMDS